MHHEDHFMKTLEPVVSHDWDHEIEYSEHEIPVHIKPVDHPYFATTASEPIGHPLDYHHGQTADDAHTMSEHYTSESPHHKTYGWPDHHHKRATCWKKASSRTSGKPVSVCDADHDLDSHLCYDKCDEGFVGHGPVCW